MITDEEMLNTYHKYRVTPGTLKCRAYALFEKGYDVNEVRFLLRHFKDKKYPWGFAGTVGRYHRLWRRSQNTKTEAPPENKKGEVEHA